MNILEMIEWKPFNLETAPKNHTLILRNVADHLDITMVIYNAQTGKFAIMNANPISEVSEEMYDKGLILVDHDKFENSEYFTVQDLSQQDASIVTSAALLDLTAMSPIFYPRFDHKNAKEFVSKNIMIPTVQPFFSVFNSAMMIEDIANSTMVSKTKVSGSDIVSFYDTMDHAKNMKMFALVSMHREWIAVQDKDELLDETYEKMVANGAFDDEEEE